MGLLNKDEYLQNLRAKQKANTVKSERAAAIKQFVDEGVICVWDRKEKKYVPASTSFIAFKLSHIKEVSDLNYFYSQCKNARSFSKFFWYALKTNK